MTAIHLQAFRLLAILAVVVGVESGLAQSGKKMTNADVVAMIKAGLGEAVILEAVRESQPAFTLDPAGLIDLKRLGASDKVLTEMQARMRRVTPTASSAPAGGRLTREVAAELLSRTTEFREPFTVTLSLDRTCVAPMTDAEYFRFKQVEFMNPKITQANSLGEQAFRLLAALGYIDLTKHQPKAGECRANKAEVLATTLTPSGEKESARWTKSGERSWVVPMSRREFTITGIQGNESQAQVEFTWRWVPVYGKPTLTGISARDGHVSASMFDDGWRLDTGSYSRFNSTFYDGWNRPNGRVDFGGVDPPATAAAGAPATAAPGAPTAPGPTLTDVKASFEGRQFSAVISGAQALLAGDPGNAEVNQLLAQAYAATGAYSEALRPAQIALTADKTIALDVLHHHVSILRGDANCIGKLELRPGQVTFTSAADASHSFSAAPAEVTRTAAVRAYEGRVEVRLESKTGNRTQNRTFNFYVLSARLVPESALMSKFECQGCGKEADALAQLIRLVAPQAKR